MAFFLFFLKSRHELSKLSIFSQNWALKGDQYTWYTLGPFYLPELAAGQTDQLLNGMYQFDGYVLSYSPSNFFKIARTIFEVIIFQDSIYRLADWQFISCVSDPSWFDSPIYILRYISEYFFTESHRLKLLK